MLLKNIAKHPVGVEDQGEHKTLPLGGSLEVSDDGDWGNHLFVKAGWLVIESGGKKEKGKQKTDQNDDPPAEFVGPYTTRSKGKGWYEVVDSLGNVVSTARQADAQAKANELNALLDADAGDKDQNDE